MKKVSTKKMVLNGLMIAVVFLVTRFTMIPGPVGYFNLGDTAIMVTAILLGRNSGFLAGAFGSALADLTSPGFVIFAPITFVVKGLEGYIMGIIASSTSKKKNAEIFRVLTVITGAVIMIGGYFIGELFILKLFDSTYGYTKAIGDLPLNLAQGASNIVIGYALSTLLIRTKAKNILSD